MNREQYIKRFEEITHDMLELTKRKNNDYSATDDNPFNNFMMVEKMGFASTEQGFLTRILDKVMRISTFVQGKKLMVADEKVTDTLEDLAVYSILFLCYLESKQGKTPHEDT